MKSISKLGLAIPILLAAAGCQVNGKVTGGGTMHSAGGSGKAVLAYTASNCENKDGEDVLKGHVTFHDKTAIDFENVGGVDFRASLTEAWFCSPDFPDTGVITNCSVCNENQYQVDVAYTSTNNAAAGEGEGTLCLIDFGTGKGLHGAAIVQIFSGPYSGYVNVGQVDGNVQSHECPGTKNDDA